MKKLFIPVLIVAVLFGCYFSMKPVSVVGEQLWMESDWALNSVSIRLSLLKKWRRVDAHSLETLFETEQEWITFMQSLDGEKVVLSPLVSEALRDSQIGEQECGKTLVGFGDPSGFSYSYSIDEYPGYLEAFRYMIVEGRDGVLLYASDVPDNIKELFGHHRKVTSDSVFFKNNLLDSLKEDRVNLIIGYGLSSYMGFEEIPEIIPSRYLYTIPRTSIEGVVTADLTPLFDSSLSEGESITLRSRFLPAKQIHAGSLKLALRALLQKAF